MLRFFTPTACLFAIILALYLAPGVYGLEIFNYLIETQISDFDFFGKFLKFGESIFGLKIIFILGITCVLLFCLLAIFGFSFFSNNSFFGNLIASIVSCGVFADRVFVVSYVHKVIFFISVISFYWLQEKNSNFIFNWNVACRFFII